MHSFTKMSTSGQCVKKCTYFTHLILLLASRRLEIFCASSIIQPCRQTVGQGKNLFTMDCSLVFPTKGQFYIRSQTIEQRPHAMYGFHLPLVYLTGASA